MAQPSSAVATRAAGRRARVTPGRLLLPTRDSGAGSRHTDTVPASPGPRTSCCGARKLSPSLVAAGHSPARPHCRLRRRSSPTPPSDAQRPHSAHAADRAAPRSSGERDFAPQRGEQPTPGARARTRWPQTAGCRPIGHLRLERACAVCGRFHFRPGADQPPDLSEDPALEDISRWETSPAEGQPGEPGLGVGEPALSAQLLQLAGSSPMNAAPQSVLPGLKFNF